MFEVLLSLRAGSVLPLLLSAIFLSWLWYSAARDRFVESSKRDDGKGAPLTFPHYVPLLGSLPIMYLWNPKGFVLSPNQFFQSPHPVLVKVLHQRFYVLRGPENVRALFKNSGICSSIPFVKFALGKAFGLPAKALSLYDKDDSGGGHVPHPDSKVEPWNRIDYRVHESLVRFLEGPGLVPFWNRFAENIAGQLHGLHDGTGSSWEKHGDLMKLVGDEATVSIVNALCGPYLLGLNPEFLQDYWDFDRNLQTYLQGIPWFLAPKAYAARKRVLKATEIWQQHARDHFEPSAIGPDGDDPYWGSSFFRERQGMFLGMDGYDHAAIASQDFGAIWAARNSLTASSWAIFEIYRDPELLASVRAEVDSCATRDADGRRPRLDIDGLLRLPVLQAVYAEVLRQRMHFYIIRMPDKVDMDVRGWIIPKQNVIVTPTTVAHMDREVWSTGSNNEHPLDQFWAGRFLRHPPDRAADGCSQPQGTAPTFSAKGLEASWIPYGGGPRQCPGRHFAKRQILLTTALWVSLFDCEISEAGRDVGEDASLSGFGGGMSYPAGDVPVRIRRRRKCPLDHPEGTGLEP